MHNFASCKLQLCGRIFSAEPSVKERSSLKELTHKFAIHNWPVIDGLSAARISLHSGQQHLWVRISGLHGGIQIMLSKRTSVHLWCFLRLFPGFPLALLWFSFSSPSAFLWLSLSSLSSSLPDESTRGYLMQPNDLISRNRLAINLNFAVLASFNEIQVLWDSRRVVLRVVSRVVPREILWSNRFKWEPIDRRLHNLLSIWEYYEHFMSTLWEHY